MKIILEFLIPLLIYISFLFLLFCLFYLIFTNKIKIHHELKINKVFYLILCVTFLAGGAIRGINVIHHKYIVLDGTYYIAQAASIAITNKFTFFQDPPSFPALISLFNRINIFHPSLGSFVNFVFGSLTILLIFIVVLFYFKNYKAAIISSILLSFSLLHYEMSINAVVPFGFSIFFIFLSLIFLYLSVGYNQIKYYVALGLSLALAAQSYYLEAFIIPAILIYFLLKKGLCFLFKLRFWILIVSIIFLTLPFILLQQLSTNEYYGNYFPFPDNSLSCSWYKNKCSLFQFGNLFKTFDVYQKTTVKEPYFVLNNHNGNLLQYLTFLFVGEGRVFRDSSDIKDLNPDNFPEKINLIYILNLLLFLSALFLAKKHKKEVLLFILIFISLLLGYSMYYTRNHIYAGYIEIIGIIPLVSLGIVLLSHHLFASKFKKSLFIIFIVILLIFQFFDENIIKKTFQTSVFNPINKNEATEFWKECSNLDILTYRNACNNVYRYLTKK